MKQHTPGPFLKWAGGKRRQLDFLNRKLPAGQRLVEPFVGAGAVFMGTDYETYLLADTNQDLIDLFHILMDDGQMFVRYAQGFFTPWNNTAERYYLLRDQFNQAPPGPTRSALFLYLNRHGFNGLCRYNRRGEFNVPFGAYRQPYFPACEMGAFYTRARLRKVEVVCQDFRQTFAQMKAGDVVYCDPPYVPLSDTAHFTAYNGERFGWDDQMALTRLAGEKAGEGVPVAINNHSHPVLNRVYREAGAVVSFRRRLRAINANPAERGGVVESTASWNMGPPTGRRVA